MKVLILGYSRAGKSTAAEILAELMEATYANSSDPLISGVAKELGVSVDHILANKDSYRDKLFAYGRAKQVANAGWPQDELLENNDIITGLRNPDEVKAARDRGFYGRGAIIWISRPGYGAGLTDKLSPDCADTIIINDGTIEELEEKLSLLLLQLRALNGEVELHRPTRRGAAEWDP